LLDANTRLNQVQREQNQTLHDLDALLGLSPDAQLNLAPLEDAGTFDTDPTLLSTLPDRRPDLLALRAGYASQEARVRQAVLAQFPSLSVGFTRARDTSDVNTVGLGITLNLPLLSGNRGAIAVQRATRAQLRQEYQARLDQTRGQIDMLEKQDGLIDQQVRRIDANLPDLAGMVDKAEHAYDAGNIDALTYLNMQNTLINKQLERVDLEEALWDTHIALDTLLGWTRWEK
jgi:cobalt-zinc-cadmium efflux system outer membrane protein